MTNRLPEGPLLVVSPHLDDAVLSCGALLATRPGSQVLTVFAGRPPSYAVPTPWDEAAGFRAGEDAVAARREEDRRALALLGAQAVWLDFLDSQYGHSPAVGELAAALTQAVAARPAAAVVIPLGLFHSDHQLVAAACLEVARRDPRGVWLAYADALYRAIPDLLDERLAALGAAGYALVPVQAAREMEPALKARAIAEYRSQVRALNTEGRPGLRDASMPEQYWRLLTPADGTTTA